MGLVKTEDLKNTEQMENTSKKASSLRWKILRRALISSSSPTDSDDISETSVKTISRKSNLGFCLIPYHLVDHSQLKVEELMHSSLPKVKEACVCYNLPDQSDIHFSILSLLPAVVRTSTTTAFYSADQNRLYQPLFLSGSVIINNPSFPQFDRNKQQSLKVVLYGLLALVVQ